MDISEATKTTPAGHSAASRVLAVDIGGSHVKIKSSAGGEERKVKSGPDMTPALMVENIHEMAKGLDFDAITMGYPGPVHHNRILADPQNLGQGWISYDFEKAFNVPLRIVNDALMQAVGSYYGQKMLFLGLGTGLGAAMVVDNVCVPLEIAHLPYRKGRTFEDYLGEASYEKRGSKKWHKHVHRCVALLSRALQPEYVIIGGGNVDRIKVLPPNALRGDNANAFAGGFRIWTDSSLVIS